MDTQHKIPLVARGLSKANQDTLEYLIFSFFKKKFYFTEDKDEKVCVFEIKTENDLELLNYQKEQNPDLYFAVITKSTIPDDERIEQITPPVLAINFVKSLDKITAKLLNKSGAIKKSETSTTNDKLKAIQSTNEIKAVNKKNITAPKPKKKPVASNNYGISTDLKAYSKAKGENSTKKPQVNEKTTIKKASVKEKKNANDDIDLSALIARAKESFEKRKADLLTQSEPQVEKKKEASKLIEPSNNKKSGSELNKTTKVKTASNNSTKGHDIGTISINKDDLKFVSSRLDVDLDNPDNFKKIKYYPEVFLQRKLIDLYKSSKGHNLSKLITMYGIITYDAVKHRVHSEVSNTMLRNISSVANLKMEVLTSDEKLQIKDDDINWKNADVMLWKTTVWASRGRIPNSCDIDKVFMLKQWPNLTRVMLTPHAMKMAALWLKRPMSLRETVSTGILQRYVFSFYSAALAQDLIEFEISKEQEICSWENTKESEIIEILDNPESNKGIVGKLLGLFQTDEVEEV